MGTGTSVVASGDLGELMPIICAKIKYGCLNIMLLTTDGF